MRERRARRLLVVYLLVLGALTVIPVLGPSVTEGFVRLAEWLGASGSESTDRLVDAGTNVVLFVPAGLLLGAAVPRLSPLTVWFICLGASVAVEVTQAVVVRSRVASVTDVLTNALGAALGVLLAVALRRRAMPR